MFKVGDMGAAALLLRAEFNNSFAESGLRQTSSQKLVNPAQERHIVS
jgi:hypothetical protein